MLDTVNLSVSFGQAIFGTSPSFFNAGTLILLYQLLINLFLIPKYRCFVKSPPFGFQPLWIYISLRVYIDSAIFPVAAIVL